jgi:4-hydroxybenzoyl-CoA reductase subunit beta
MLRLPEFAIERPKTTAQAVRLLAELGEDGMLVAGGTDLLPNMKHELFTPKTLVALSDVEELSGIREGTDGSLAIGAMTTVDEVAKSELVRERAPVLAQAASLIAGPQLRRMGTIGGNVMLDTRCQWYNQTHFWRQALGYCLKKDGTVCHVVAGGKKCVAAASNDTAPALMTLGAKLVIEGSSGPRETSVDDLWKADGIFNKKIAPEEVLTTVHVPAQGAGHRSAYGKLRDRGSIDFPLLGVAVRLDSDPDGAVRDADVVCVALQARPVRIKKAAEELSGVGLGSPELEDAARAVADAAHRQCRPLANVPGDHEYRREMVPVYVRRTLLAAAAGDGPVHHV